MVEGLEVEGVEIEGVDGEVEVERIYSPTLRSMHTHADAVTHLKKYASTC